MDSTLNWKFHKIYLLRLFYKGLPDSKLELACTSANKKLAREFVLMGDSSFSLLSTVYSKYVDFKNCQWLDLNHGPLVCEATILPVEPQPLPTPL